MMKNMFIGYISLMSFFCFPQDQLKYTENGLTESAIVKFDSLSQDFIFKKAEEWYKKNKEFGKFFINKINRKKSFIRIKGVKYKYTFIEFENFTEYYDAEFVLEIYIRNGEYEIFPKKLKFCPYEEFYDEDKSTMEELFFCKHIDIKKYDTIYYTKFGGITRFPKLIEDLFNGINNDLENFIKEESIKSKL